MSNDFYFSLEKEVAKVTCAITLKRFQFQCLKPADRRLYLQGNYELILKDIEPFFYDYDSNDNPHCTAHTKQGFILYFDRFKFRNRIAIMLCFYYDFNLKKLVYYFHPDPKSRGLQDYDEVYKLCKDRNLNNWVFRVPFINRIYNILKSHFSFAVSDDFVSEKELEILNKDLLLKRIHFNKTQDLYETPFDYVLPKWRLDIICYIHQYDRSILNREEKPQKQEMAS